MSCGQICLTPKRIEAKGYATVQTSTTDGNRSRSVYHITPSGRKALEKWLDEPIDHSILRDEMQLNLFVGGHTIVNRTLAVTKDFQQQQLERLVTLEQDLEEIKPSLQSGILPYEFTWLEPTDLSEKERKEIYG